MKTIIRLEVNGREREVATEPMRTLLEVLREDLGLTGTKQGCGEGECGTCTVLLDGAPVNACLVLAIDAQGRRVTTIEGLARGATLHPLQKAFIDKGAIQCGFCTPGMILSAKALLDRIPVPSDEQIREALSGNLCRCTGYQKIVEAVGEAAREMSGDEGGGR
jgi:aerobic carbon-monoxide dehydrogenase small subunit